MTKYTLGFLFDIGINRVVLIKKIKPEWQKDKLNGVGGHVEDDETSIAAQEREFKEETTYDGFIKWIPYATMTGPDFNIDCFTSMITDVSSIEARTEEQIVILSVRDIYANIYQMVENLPWLIHLAIDSLCDARPAYTTIKYD